jgi:hypothetical protein
MGKADALREIEWRIITLLHCTEQWTDGQEKRAQSSGSRSDARCVEQSRTRREICSKEHESSRK